MPLRLTDLLGGKCCWQVNLSASPITINLTRHDEHTIRVYKVTEDNSAGADGEGVLRFGGLSLDNGGVLTSKPRSQNRRIEVIGDSDTCGWCADGAPDDGLLGSSFTQPDCCEYPQCHGTARHRPRP